MSWDKLSMADRAKIINLSVSHGVTDLGDIHNIYDSLHENNKFAGGGILTNEELLEKIHALGHKAKINSKGQLVTMAGTPLVYNYDKDRFEFLGKRGSTPMWLAPNGEFTSYNTKSSTGAKKEKRLKRILKYPALYQTILEDAAFVKNRAAIDKKKAVPYKGKEVKIAKGKSKGVPITTNLIDSIKGNIADRRGQLGILGIGSQETDMAKYPSYFVKKPGENKNFSNFREQGQVSPTDLLNNHNFFISPMRGSLNRYIGRTSKGPMVYGASNSYYTPTEFLYLSDEALQNANADAAYQRYKGRFNPRKKVVSKNKNGEVIQYYNPEDNPWRHALDNLNDRNYGMGESYRTSVDNAAKDIEYLLNYNLVAPNTTKSNRFDGTSTPTQQMYRTVPISQIPEEYRLKTITSPSGEVRNWEDVDPNYRIYVDERNAPLSYNPTIIKDNTEIPNFGIEGIPIYAGPDLAQISLQDEINKRQADRFINNEYTAGKFLSEMFRPLNFASPSQQFGAIVDWAQGEKGYWEGLMQGNSGFFSDKFAQEHPYWALAGNIGIDFGLGIRGLDGVDMLTNTNNAFVKSFNKGITKATNFIKLKILGLKDIITIE